jgi:hypothetical protein
MGTAKLPRRSPELKLTTIDREDGRSRLAVPVPEALESRMRPDRETWSLPVLRGCALLFRKNPVCGIGLDDLR